MTERHYNESSREFHIAASSVFACTTSALASPPLYPGKEYLNSITKGFTPRCAAAPAPPPKRVYNNSILHIIKMAGCAGVARTEKEC